MHGLVTGQESRQQLYTMLTRGRAANHLYLQVVGDGDPHSLIRPDTVAPRTPTEILRQILGRDEAPPQLARCCENSATRLPGCSRPFSATPTGSISRPSGWLAPRLFRSSIAKPTRSSLAHLRAVVANSLRAHLLALAAETGEHPLLHLHEAALGRDLSTAEDMAAVLDWRSRACIC